MDLQLISFKDYATDPYTKAICSICIDGKHVVSYGKKIMKDGREFWTTANHSVQENGVKSFVEGYLPESRSMEKQIKDFISKAERDFKGEVPKDSEIPF